MNVTESYRANKNHIPLCLLMFTACFSRLIIANCWMIESHIISFRFVSTPSSKQLTWKKIRKEIFLWSIEVKQQREMKQQLRKREKNLKSLCKI